jgi:hypothetical protein
VPTSPAVRMVSTLKTKEADVTSLHASLVLKQQQAEAFQAVPHTYRWLIVTMYYKPLVHDPLLYYEVAILVNKKATNAWNQSSCSHPMHSFEARSVVPLSHIQ